MKKNLLLFLAFLVSYFGFSQSPGGVSQPDVWGRVIKNTSAVTFQYKDFAKGNKSIMVGGMLTPSLFNYNYSYTYNSNNFISFLSKIESLKDATIFVIYKSVTPSNPTDKIAIMNSDWISSVLSPSINEQSFKFSTSTFEKNGSVINYPPTSGTRSPGRINTIIWHSFNSRRIVNSYGNNGESNVYIGKAFAGALNFQGEIPEFIVYRRALNTQEKIRVESYLALKYGITLDAGVNYTDSRNEIFWHKENNVLFGNRIFGLGRDSNTTLYQRQSVSADDTAPTAKLTFWTGGFAADNYLNTTSISDHNYTTIGDNNATEIPATVLNNGIKKINRIWLTENFGSASHNQSTNLKYLADPTITLLPNEAFWLLIDKDANNLTESNFNGANVETFQVPNLTSGYATFSNLKWASSSTKYNQFTFGVGPKMLISATPLPLACVDSNGTVNFTIKGGSPNFTVNVHGTNNTYNQQLLQSTRNFSQVLPLGSYLATITDNTGFIQTINFTISPTPGIILELGPNQTLSSGSTLTLNAALNITATSVSYKWLKDSVLVATTPIFDITQGGNYECIVTNLSNNCSVSDTIVITTLQVSQRENAYSNVFPNPSTGLFSVKIVLTEVADVNVSLIDISGKKLNTIKRTGLKEYELNFEHYTAGVYLIKVESSDYTISHKIIIN